MAAIAKKSIRWAGRQAGGGGREGERGGGGVGGEGGGGERVRLM